MIAGEKKITLCGMGPGHMSYVTGAALERIKGAEVLIGGKRHLAQIQDEGKEKIEITGNLNQTIEYIQANARHKKIVVLASGEPSLFGIGAYLHQNCAGVGIETIPGISALQYLAGKTGLTLDNTYLTSLHGAGVDGKQIREKLRTVLGAQRKVGLFLDGASAGNVCRWMCEWGLGSASIAAGENLSYPEERILKGTAAALASEPLGPLTVMLLEVEREAHTMWPYVTPGIADNLFERGAVPMTKSEVRAITLSKMKLETSSVVWDIGAGTGSVTVEAALMAKRGQVVAFEKNRDACGLIRQNVEKFRLQNVDIQCCCVGADPLPENIPLPDRVFIGGNNGYAREIIGLLAAVPMPLLVAVNCIVVENSAQWLNLLQQHGFNNIEILNAQISRSVDMKGKHRMEALNPVSIITAQKGGGN